MEPKVVTIVLNYNGEKCLLDTLTSLKNLTYSNNRVLVVDSYSTDSSFREAKKVFPQFSFLSLSKNGGFAYGMNEGIKEALKKEADFIWLFNYDALAAKESLTELVKASVGDNEKSLMSPCIYDQNGKMWFEGGRIDFWRMRATHIKERNTLKRPFDTGFLTGCALFIPVSVIKRIGMLDEAFFLYYEDVDYSLRALNKGFFLKIVPTATVIHLEKSIENPQKNFYLVFSALYFFQKHKTAFFSFYQAIYVILRRFKNQIDLLVKKSGAKEVERAYQDFYGKGLSSIFNHFR